MPSSDTRAWSEFIIIAVNNKASYAIVAVAEEKELIANFAQETTKLLHYENLAFWKFRLDILSAPPLLPKTADAIELWYSCLQLQAKIKFHVNQM